MLPMYENQALNIVFTNDLCDSCQNDFNLNLKPSSGLIRVLPGRIKEQEETTDEPYLMHGVGTRLTKTRQPSS